MLINYYEQRLRDFCHNFRPYINGDPTEIRLPVHTIYTACTYFKRLYLNHSCMDYHPRLTYFGCVWLALKVEEFFVEIDPFCYNAMGGKEAAHQNYQATQDLGDDILAIELLLMRALNYELVVHHPFRAIDGFILDIKTVNPSRVNMSGIDFTPLHHKAIQLAFDSLRTNLMFLFNPSQLALAFLAIGAKEIKPTHKHLTEIFNNYMKSYLVSHAEMKKKLLSIVKEVEKTLKITKARPEISAADIENLKKKLELCRNPLFNPTTKEFKKAELSDDESQGNPDDTIRTIESNMSEDEPDLLG